MKIDVDLQINNIDKWITHIELLKSQNGSVTIEEALSFEFEFRAEIIASSHPNPLTVS